MESVNKRNHPNSITYICHDCTLVFSVHSPNKRMAHPHCPYCADSVAVRLYVPAPRKAKKWRPWTAEELALIDQILDGKLAKYQVAAKIGRTYGSIQRKCEIKARERANGLSEKRV